MSEDTDQMVEERNRIVEELWKAGPPDEWNYTVDMEVNDGVLTATWKPKPLSRLQCDEIHWSLHWKCSVDGCRAIGLGGDAAKHHKREVAKATGDLHDMMFVTKPDLEELLVLGDDDMERRPGWIGEMPETSQ